VVHSTVDKPYAAYSYAVEEACRREVSGISLADQYIKLNASNCTTW